MSRRKQSAAARESFWLMTACYEAPGSQEVRDRWEPIWRETVAGDKIGTVDIEATRNILWGGWHIAMHDGRLREAADLLASFFAHPEIEQADWVSSVSARSYLAYSLLRVGDEREALTHLRLLMDSPTNNRSALLHAKVTLRMFCCSRNGADVASEALTELVREVVHRVKRRKMRCWQPDALSYGDLVQLLHSTLSAKDRERVQRNREAAMAEAHDDPRIGAA
jgi:hypothetical protein